MFTENLKYYRINSGLSQEKLAEIAGVSIRTIQRLESGDTDPRGDTVIRLSKALDVSLEDLLQYKKQEDRSYLKAISVSSLSFLLFPILGILIPFILWIIKKEKIEDLNRLGKQIINFQITWNIMLFLGLIIYSLWYFSSITTITEISFSLANHYIIIFCTSFGLIYLYNLFVSLSNLYFVWKNKNVRYNPYLRFIK